jgi:CIC family chloride channel protein
LRSCIPLVIACTLSTSVRAVLLGQKSMFTMGNVNFDVLHGLPFYLILGVICGGAAVGFTKLLYWVEDRFAALPIDDLWHPAIGALGLGIIGFFVPRVLGVGYDTISDILNNNLALKLLLLVMIFKAIALVISLGSGTSGGLLAPMFMSSAALGGVFAVLVNTIFPSAHLSPGAYALVAMAAVFGAASRATFAFIVFAFEITRNYDAILPLMLACVIAAMIALRYLPSSIMTEKLSRRGLKVPEGYETGILKIVRVEEVMRKDVQPVPAQATVRELAGRMGMGRRQDIPRDENPRDEDTGIEILANASGYRNVPSADLLDGLPIVGRDGKLEGVVTQGDLLRSLESDPSGETTVLEAGSGKPVVAYPDELAMDAMWRMLENNIGRLPVVSRENPRQMIGFFTRASVLNVWLRERDEESLREHGWLRRWGMSPRGM